MALAMALAEHAQVQQWVWLLVAGAAAVAVLWKLYWKKQRRMMTLPPGPPKLPVFGNLLALIGSANPHQELHRLAQQYGPIMSLRLGSKQGMVMSSPEMAKEVLRTLDKEFANRPTLIAKDTLGYGDYSLLYASYTTHCQFLRKNASLELLSPRRIQQFADVRAEETSRVLRSILEDSEKLQPEAVLDMNQRTYYMVMNMVTRTLVNKRFFAANSTEDSELVAAATDSGPGEKDTEAAIASRFKALMEEVFFLAGLTLIGDVIPRLGFLDRIMNYKGAMVRAHQRMDSFLDPLLEEHRQRRQQLGKNNFVEKDLVDILLSLPGQDGVPKLDAITVKAQLFDMLSAGVDTSSSTLEWALAELLRHPSVMRKLQDELDSVVGRDRVVVEADLAQLPYLQQVVKEVLRLHPPAPLLAPHENWRACTIAGYHIPPRTTTLVNVWSIGRNPEVWPDQPLRFMPERFADRDTAPDVRGQHFELLPFGAGRRGCPGLQLALTVVQYGLARLVHSFQWELPPGQPPHLLDMAEKFGLTLHRATPLLALPRPRLPRQLY